MRRGIAAALILVAVAAGCAKKATTAGSGSGITGTVKVGPLCPVVVKNSPCPERPIQAVIDAVDSTAHHYGPFTTKADGTFKIALPPGTYVVSGRDVGDNPRLARPVTVTVSAGSYASVNLHILTGVVGPLPLPSYTTPGY